MDEVCSLTIHPRLPAVVVEWKDYATSGQLRESLDQVLGLLEKHHLHLILGDDTHLPIVHSEDQDWIATDWMPRARSAGLRGIASVHSAHAFGRVSVSNVQKRLSDAVDVRAFKTRREAEAWLSAVNVQ